MSSFSYLQKWCTSAQLFRPRGRVQQGLWFHVQFHHISLVWSVVLEKKGKAWWNKTYLTRKRLLEKVVSFDEVESLKNQPKLQRNWMKTKKKKLKNCVAFTWCKKHSNLKYASQVMKLPAKFLQFQIQTQCKYLWLER